MNLPKIVSRDEWVAERLALLAKEKAHSKARDVLHSQRQALPRFLVEKEYHFDTEDGKLSLLELFESRRQLIVYHFMVPEETGGMFCPGCSFWMDSLPHPAHINARDTSLVVDCRAPIADFLAHKERMGWNGTFVSSFGTDFYADFYFPLDKDEEQQPGVSVFLREDDKVYYTYSTHDRGTDLINNTYNYLDLTALGRQEKELPFKWAWLRYHDGYDS
jgi:predicted dithiol-disulfide oxidoreductase (DUF899 family)